LICSFNILESDEIESSFGRVELILLIEEEEEEEEEEDDDDDDDE
jgi:hypothetical protein